MALWYLNFSNTNFRVLSLTWENVSFDSKIYLDEPLQEPLEPFKKFYPKNV